MTDNITERPPLPFLRCPDCQAVAWQGWDVTHRHRPPCRFEGTDPEKWSSND